MTFYLRDTNFTFIRYNGHSLLINLIIYKPLFAKYTCMYSTIIIIKLVILKWKTFLYEIYIIICEIIILTTTLLPTTIF